MTIYFEAKRNGIAVLLQGKKTQELGVITKYGQANTFIAACDAVVEDWMAAEINNKIERLNWLGL